MSCDHFDGQPGTDPLRPDARDGTRAGQCDLSAATPLCSASAGQGLLAVGNHSEVRLALRTRRLFLAVFLAVFFGGLAVGALADFSAIPVGMGPERSGPGSSLGVIALTLSGLGLGFRRP